MPAIRLTLASNANQSTKCPILIPASASTNPTASSSVRALVFKSAQAKLRVKKPTRVFVGRSGQELVSEADWKSNINNDVVLLVSAGEDYVGARKVSGVHADANPQCPVEVLASEATLVEPLALTQLGTTARTLPGIIHAVGQPDLHPGTKFPIGAVFASKGWIHPPLIGGDIGCGMAWYKTTLNRSQVDGNKGKNVANQLRGLEGAWRNQDYREKWLLDEDNCSISAGKQWDAALGTIGAGNHFAEIQVVEESGFAKSDDGLHQDDVVLLVHSGSRGLGGSILKKYTTDSRTSFPDDSEDANAYLEEHNKACEWAKANRDLIALRFLACLEPGNEDWQLGDSNASDFGEEGITMIATAKAALRKRKVVDIWHNNVECVAWPPPAPSSAAEEPTPERSLTEALDQIALGDENTPKEYVFLHRKGAAPTYDPKTQLPLSLLPLPGSRSTATLILQPTFSEANSWGLKNGLSLAHGAGRAMSRAKALQTLGKKYKGINILEPNAENPEGTWVICDEKDLVFEEAPWAYKTVQDVAADLVAAGAAKIIGWCCPRVSYKVRKELDLLR
ncbi:hypothetical protein J4E89_007476 [Alternaria sp. Ai002NY15]|nr:hypothetical protein J4E89_007476 [Alternaria sp. Ai002NY15]